MAVANHEKAPRTVAFVFVILFKSESLSLVKLIKLHDVTHTHSSMVVAIGCSDEALRSR